MGLYNDMAELLPIKIYPAKNLADKSKDIQAAELLAPEFQQLVLDMEKTMIEEDGVGLAAPQVGLNICLAVIATEDGTLVLINPKIVKRSWRKEIDEEGCLSVPGVFGLVKRSAKVRVSALDAKGEELNFEAKGFLARVVQHELDHLDGVLFIDKARKIVKGKDELEKMEKELRNKK